MINFPGDFGAQLILISPCVPHCLAAEQRLHAQWRVGPGCLCGPSGDHFTSLSDSLEVKPSEGDTNKSEG